MRAEDVGIVLELRKIKNQLDAAICALEAELPLKQTEIKINQGYEIGDFIIIPRFPKTEVQG